MSESQPDRRTNGQNSGEIMLFGVRVKVDPMRKSVSMNDLSQYVQASPDASTAVAADSGYASADDAARNQSNGGRDRKRGIPWTEDEHKLFLLGLQKVGKGDWRGISRNFVKTRTPTQVASHAQKYFLRRSNLNRRRRRSSLFDITTDSVAAMEEQQVLEDNDSQPNQIEAITFNNRDQLNGGQTILVLPNPNLSTRGDYYLDQKHEIRDSLSLSLSLNLSLSCDHHNGTDSSAFQAISRFNNGDSIISVG